MAYLSIVGPTGRITGVYDTEAEAKARAELWHENGCTVEIHAECAAMLRREGFYHPALPELMSNFRVLQTGPQTVAVVIA